jgi:hypothetical protein
LAQEILTKKLGNLSPTTETSSSDMFNSLAQYFEQPLPKQRMEALMAQERILSRGGTWEQEVQAATPSSDISSSFITQVASWR